LNSVRLKEGGELSVGKIICLARNYAEHAKEMKGALPEAPVLFLKPSTALAAPGAIRLPDFSKEVHHEVELVVAIGKTARRIAAQEAPAFILGYGVGLDLTARDLQRRAKERGEPWSVAKGFDGAAPVSEIVSAVEAGDVSDLAITLRVNGDLRQSGRTSQMVFKIPEILAEASRAFTLERGDLLFTGTPSGVGPLRPGDKLLAEVERVARAEWRVEG
jgi:5-carboxymethyl-2-hydroxymuconate isomerase